MSPGRQQAEEGGGLTQPIERLVRLEKGVLHGLLGPVIAEERPRIGEARRGMPGDEGVEGGPIALAGAEHEVGDRRVRRHHLEVPVRGREVTALDPISQSDDSPSTSSPFQLGWGASADSSPERASRVSPRPWNSPPRPMCAV